MESILIPIFVCVVLPVSIVAIVFKASINSDNKRAQVLIKAIESNCGINTDKLAEALRKPKKTAREILNLRLLRGCIFSLIGLGFLVIVILSLTTKTSLYYDPSYLPFSLIICIPSLAIGISYLTVYFATRKQIKD